MTAKRDLKKRIRDRQAKTGDSYTTARRHVLAARADHDDGDAGDNHDDHDDSGDDHDRDDRNDKVGDVEVRDRAIAEGKDIESTHADVANATIAKPPDIDTANAEHVGPTGDRFADELDVVRARESADRDELEATNPGIAKGEVGRGEMAAASFADALEELQGKGSGAGEAVEVRRLSELRQPIEVDEVIDFTDAAKAVGFACKVLVYPRLAKVADTNVVLTAVRDALGGTHSNHAMQLLRAVIAGQAHKMRVAQRPAMPRDPEFMEKISAGLSAVSSDGRMLALQVNGFAGMVTVVCAAWRASNTLVITTPEDRLGPVLAGVGAFAGEALFLVYEGRRYPIRKLFVIGRSKMCDLQIRDGNVSRKHAAITYKQGGYYIVDLDSTNGIEYRGMKIRNKRIEEGDMFVIGRGPNTYALRFTFHETDA